MVVSYLCRGLTRLIASTSTYFQRTGNIGALSATNSSGAERTDRQSEISVAFTAKLCAAARALEHERGDRRRLIKDELAFALAGPVAMQSAKDRIRNSSARRSPRIAIRCKYFDDYIAEALRNKSANGKKSVQLVFLGAGMDTRAFRLAGIERATCVFEVDNMSVLTEKRDALNMVSTRPRLRARKLRAVGADLASDDWPGGLLNSGFDQDVCTIWVVEGVLYYLEDSQVLDLFKKVADLSAIGSRLIFSAITRPPRRNTENAAASLFKSCIPDPESLLESFDFIVNQVDVFGGPNASFGRCVESDLHDRDDWRYEQTTIYVTATKE